MDQEQTPQSTQPIRQEPMPTIQPSLPSSQTSTQPDRPVLVTIIAILMIASGVLLILTFAVLLIVVSLSPEIKNKVLLDPSIPFIAVAIIMAIIFLTATAVNFIVAAGLLKMKKWAIYTLTAVVVLAWVGVVKNLITEPKFDATVMGAILNTIILIYLWSIHKQFNGGQNGPRVINATSSTSSTSTTTDTPDNADTN